MFKPDSQVFDPVQLVNCTYHLLEQFQQSKRVREELENRFVVDGIDNYIIMHVVECCALYDFQSECSKFSFSPSANVFSLVKADICCA